MFLSLSIISAISVLLYLFAPMSYSYEYSFACLVLFIISSSIMLKQNCKKTFIKFEFFFTIAFFFTNYVYSIVYYPIDPYFSLFALPFNESYITKGLALSTVGICFFNLGIFENKYKLPTFQAPKFQRVKKPKLVFTILMCIFLPYLSTLAMLGGYSTDFESSLVNAILQYIIYYYIFASFHNISKNPSRTALLNEFGILQLSLLVAYVMLFLTIGSRTIPMRIFLFTLIIYSIYYHSISKKIIVIMTILGTLLMAHIGLERTGYTIGTGSAWDFAAELVINNRSLYVLMEYYDTVEATLGRTFLMSILSVIPFGQSIFLGITGWTVKDISSGNLVTHLYYKDVIDYDRMTGLGTNVIGDIYVAFGLIGVIVIMFILGNILKKLSRSITYNPTNLLIYSLLFMEVIYATRASVLLSLRSIVWTLTIMYICKRGWKIIH